MPLKSLHFHIRFFTLVTGVLFSTYPLAATGSSAPKKDAQTIRGDKAYAKLKFAKAIINYTNSLENGGDTLYLEQRIAASYKALNDQVNAEKAYAHLANNPKAGNINKYYYAELLRVDKSYASARKYYEQYSQAASNPQNLNATIEQMDKIPALSVENPAYKISPLNINTPKSDYDPVFYKDGKLIFSSNRDKKNALFDKWTMAKFSRLYITSIDSNAKAEKIKLNPQCKSAVSGAAYSAPTSQLIFSSGSFKKKYTALKDGKRLPVMNLYSVIMSGNNATDLIALNINGDFSNAHPALSKDGKTMYFASDRLGGQGGTDIYVSTLNVNGIWSDPQNLGDAVNTPYDEKFPFIADDGTLYFASNTPSGLGGLDIYKTQFADGKWSKPQNLGAPINSSYDDFSLIIDNAEKTGFFASNRPGGKGEDDIYRFTYNGDQLDYNVKIRVLDANTLNPVAAASLALDCQTATAANTLTDATGEKEFTITGGKTCSVEAWSPGYKSGNVDISPINSNGMLIISLLRDSGQSVPATTSASNAQQSGKPGMNKLPNAGDQDKLMNESSSLYVPVKANCASGGVIIIDLKTDNQNTIKADANGEVQFDLQLNRKYIIQHGETADTISTKGLRPNTEIVAGCTYRIGQISVVHNIYYNVNRWDIRKDAQKQLDRLVVIMKENPSLQIELSSHTDCRAGSRYNMVLSARRAKSAVDYVVRKGIKMQRFVAAGFGESKLTNDCVCEPGNYSPCDEQQHQANRRTEIKVLKY